MSFNLFTSALINGRGQYNGNNAPLPWFTVEPDSEIGFYMINSGIEYTFSISIDQHDMEITSLGVGQVESRTVNTVYLNPGYGISGCGVFKAGIQNQKGFWLKNQLYSNEITKF